MVLPEADKSFVDAAVDAYDGLSGDQLEWLTHHDEPWCNCYNQRMSASASSVMLAEAMRDYYVRLLTAPEEDVCRST